MSRDYGRLGMFHSRYPKAKLIRVRILQSFSGDRNLAIVPKAFPPLPPPEVKHRHSSLIPSPVPGKLMVVEWTDAQVELHDVDF